MNWRNLLLGQAHFADGHEYTAFKYTFALATLWITLPLLALFIAGDVLGANKVGYYSYAIRAYFLLLRNRQERLTPAVWVFAAASLGVHISGFLFVPGDESRLV